MGVRAIAITGAVAAAGAMAATALRRRRSLGEPSFVSRFVVPASLEAVARFHADPKGRDDPQGDDSFSKAVIAAVQQEGTCWAGGTHWRDQEAMRISVSNWSTTEADIERSAEAIIRCCRAARAAKVA